jgi:hypothetical protein
MLFSDDSIKSRPSMYGYFYFACGLVAFVLALKIIIAALPLHGKFSLSIDWLAANYVWLIAVLFCVNAIFAPISLYNLLRFSETRFQRINKRRESIIKGDNMVYKVCLISLWGAGFALLPIFVSVMGIGWLFFLIRQDAFPDFPVSEFLENTIFGTLGLIYGFGGFKWFNLISKHAENADQT